MAADTESTVRQRKANESSGASAADTKKSAKSKKDSEDAYSPWVDIFRVLTFVLLASCGLSYLVTGGQSFAWGMKNPPKYLSVNYWKSQLQPLKYMTLEELAAYDGSDPEKPIYLAINGTIFDVTANPRMYGPGGSYNVFAGTDASRGFITGCFLDDRTGDMRGVEEMFMPLDDPEVDAHFSSEELASLREAELAAAMKQVNDALSHWVNFFDKHAKYMKVGYVKRPAGWPETEQRRALCKPAAEGRKKRTAPNREL